VVVAMASAAIAVVAAEAAATGPEPRGPILTRTDGDAER
jgi:hypothetical protein